MFSYWLGYAVDVERDNGQIVGCVGGMDEDHFGIEFS
jgi:hypothetical protein